MQLEQNKLAWSLAPRQCCRGRAEHRGPPVRVAHVPQFIAARRLVKGHAKRCECRCQLLYVDYLILIPPRPWQVTWKPVVTRREVIRVVGTSSNSVRQFRYSPERPNTIFCTGEPTIVAHSIASWYGLMLVSSHSNGPRHHTVLLQTSTMTHLL